MMLIFCAFQAPRNKKHFFKNILIYCTLTAFLIAPSKVVPKGENNYLPKILLLKQCVNPGAAVAATRRPFRAATRLPPILSPTHYPEISRFLTPDFGRRVLG